MWGLFGRNERKLGVDMLTITVTGLLVTVGISFLSQLGLVYVPFMQAIVQTEALPMPDGRPVLASCARGGVVRAARESQAVRAHVKSA